MHRNPNSDMKVEYSHNKKAKIKNRCRKIILVSNEINLDSKKN